MTVKVAGLQVSPEFNVQATLGSVVGKVGHLDPYPAHIFIGGEDVLVPDGDAQPRVQQHRLVDTLKDKAFVEVRVEVVLVGLGLLVPLLEEGGRVGLKQVYLRIGVGATDRVLGGQALGLAQVHGQGAIRIPCQMKFQFSEIFHLVGKVL